MNNFDRRMALLITIALAVAAIRIDTDRELILDG